MPWLDGRKSWYGGVLDLARMSERVVGDGSRTWSDPLGAQRPSGQVTRNGHR